MSKGIEIIYFSGCPNAEVVIAILKQNNLVFEITNQADLHDDDPRKFLSSPSILVNNVQVYGNSESGTSASCTLSNTSSEAVLAAIPTALGGTK